MVSSKHGYLQPKLRSCYFCVIRKQINTHFELQRRLVTSDLFFFSPPLNDFLSSLGSAG